MNKKLALLVLLVFIFTVTFVVNGPQQGSVPRNRKVEPTPPPQSQRKQITHQTEVNRNLARQSENKPQSFKSIKETFPQAIFLKENVSEVDNRNIYTRSTIAKTNMKYPLILVEEKFKVSRAGSPGDDIQISQVKMVADHVMVRLAKGKTRADMEEIARKYNASIRQRMRLSGLYLVAFNAETDAVKNMIENFRRENRIVRSSPDYIVSGY